MATRSSTIQGKAQDKATNTYQQTAVSHTDGLLTRIVRGISDWLSGPPMTERDRLNHTLAEIKKMKEIGPQMY